MIKFFLGIAIVAFTSFCGYLLAKKYRQKKSFFVQLKEFNERFIGEISYYRRPLIEFVEEYTYKNEFRLLLEDFFENIKNERIVMKDILSTSDYTFLNEEEKNMVGNYFLMLGKGDSASQKAYFSSVKDTLSKLTLQADTTCKKYADLYIKIGFLFGLLILILIV